jgi:propanol-preferring alcohol dehydrogenase
MPNTEVTYRAVHAVSPRKLELTRKPLVDPRPGYVRIRVEACGVCHTDATTVEGVFPIAWPRVPGHEAVGIIDKLDEGIEGWVLGQRVGVGFLVAVVGIANSAGAATLSIVATRSLRECNTMVAMPRC